MIAQATIDKVYEIARVEEVIQDYVQLKKSGANYKGLSPFNSERTPSFMVSPVKQIWKDFSSGKGGNVVAFLMEVEHYTYPEAIRHLANKYQIEVEETYQDAEAKALQDHKESLFLVNEYASQFFVQQLHQSTVGKSVALSYFQERGFTLETIEKFGLGFGGTSYDGLANAARTKGHPLTYLSELGLCIERESNGEKAPQAYIDRFRERVIFPIHSTSGRVLGFGGRILDSQKKVAKYVNSPESAIYHKSKVLYGIYFAKSAIAKRDNCYLVEGYTDVIQLHQKGIENVVSSSGTALSESQIRMIQRLCSTITVLFDGDEAGVRASLRSIDMILREGMNVRVVSFENGEDPDSFARAHTPGELSDYLMEGAIDFIEFKTGVLLKEAEGDANKKAGAIRDIVGSIACIPDSISQELYIRKTAQMMQVSEEVLFSYLADLKSKEQRENKKTVSGVNHSLEVVARAKDQTSPKVNRLKALETDLAKIILLYGQRQETFVEDFLVEDESGHLKTERLTRELPIYEKVFLELQEDEVQFTDERLGPLVEKAIEFYRSSDQDRHISDFIRQLAQNGSQELVDLASSLLLEDEKYVLHDWEKKNIYAKKKTEGLLRLVEETLWSLRAYWLSERIKELQELSKSDPTAISEVPDYIQLNQILSRKLNRVLSI